MAYRFIRNELLLLVLIGFIVMVVQVKVKANMFHHLTNGI